MAKILIIDDEERLRGLLARIIGLEGYEVAQAGDCAAGLKMLERYDPDVVLCDVKLPDGNGVEMVGKIKAASPAAEVILLTAYGNIPDGVQAIKNGAFDYITKGDDNNKILPLLNRAAEKAGMQRRLARIDSKLSAEHSFDRIIGKSEAMRQAVELARKVAATDASVLLTGETGTGKEVFAQAIHHASPRAKGAFVAVNCSAFSKDLLESELFGHRAGSFTGATKDKKGLFEEADKGTLLLDEIGEMPVELQAKLLRVLESGEFIKVGETRPTKADVRIIAATNRDLRKEIAAGNFREDLYFRLSVFCICLPSLRERRGDIPEYIRFFAAHFADKMGRRIERIDDAYIAALERHAWQGNVRELRNVVERSLIMAEGNALTADCLSPEFRMPKSAGAAVDSLALDDLERGHILKVLETTHGNKAEAARLLGIGIATLYRKLESYGVK
ncbi:MAG: sigma-54 dependent transcriptional regulator [Rikenellaceae bacterium]|nr:sigma-54 dependent transcriptional regulator [Rikenellaceae bacterium]